ncbi:substrate-binding domain-containing protein [Hydrogenophaga sp. 5NK40-0174]|uniref:molybdate ABC transporter substrate-binding protein n=1 Tax=Hydrogenophaga sp. 5NK40-0174 TaxID=3127649 RepID=UPI00310B5311
MAKKKIKLLGGGAIQGLVAQLHDAFLEETGCEVVCQFDAVGTIEDGVTDGEPADLVALTDAQITQMAADGLLVPGSTRILGVVKTGIAVRKADQSLDVSTAEALEAALLAADGVYIPDPSVSTAGAHIQKVLRRLGIDEDDLAKRLHVFPDSEQALAALAKGKGKGLLGCIQTTEIRFAPKVFVAGMLPGKLGLSTIYSVAVTSQSKNPELAAQFISKLIGADAAPVRADIGFEA